MTDGMKSISPTSRAPTITDQLTDQAQVVADILL